MDCSTLLGLPLHICMYVLQVSVLGCDSRLERDGTDSMGWRVICPPDHTGTESKDAPRSVEAPWDEEAVRQLCLEESQLG